jgi:acyl-CoA synthetase (AMP-forming)/AMP-acid ligase II
MIYTSGTTGKPKGALRTRTDRNVVFALLAELNLLHENSVHLTTGPMYHSGPLAFASLSHTLGAPIVVLRKFDPRRWITLVKEHRVTNTFSAPTQLKRIVSLPAEDLAKADMSSMVTLIANAAPVPYALKQEIIEKLGDGFLYEVYGSTELGVDTVLKPEDQLRKPGSCGKPYGGIEVRIVKDDGTDLRNLVAHLGKDRRLFGIDHHRRRVGVVDDVLHLLGVEAVRQRHRDEVRLARGVNRRQHLERVRTAPNQAIAGHRSRREQTVREAVHERVQLGERRARRRRATALVDDDRHAVGRTLRVDGQGIKRFVHSCDPRPSH